MVTLQIDDDTFAVLRAQAEANGLTVEEWLKRSFHPGESTPTEGGMPLSREEWHERLKAFIDRHRPTGQPMDDSRESIYD